MKLLTLFVIWLVSLVALKAQGKCAKVWVDDDAVFESRSMAQTVKYERKTRKLTWKNDREEEKSKTLTSDNLEKILSQLCLTQVQNEPPPPPGGPADIQITNGKDVKRLGWKGNTGGSYYLLRPNELKTLFNEIYALTH